jgi:hypothetical protein
VTAMLVRQVGNLLRAMHDAHEARSELGAAGDMQRVARRTLAELLAQAEHWMSNRQTQPTMLRRRPPGSSHRRYRPLLLWCTKLVRPAQPQ